MELNAECQFILQAFKWTRRHPLTATCILSYFCFNFLMYSLEQDYPMLQQQVKNIGFETFVKLFLGIHCVRMALHGYRGGRPMLLVAHFVFALTYFVDFYLAVAETASKLHFLPTGFDALIPMEEWLKDHHKFHPFIWVGQIYYYMYRMMPESGPVRPAKSKPIEKDIQSARNNAGDLWEVGEGRIFS